MLVTSTLALTETTNWHHVVATKNGATLRLYIDGVDVTGTITNSTAGDSTGVLCLGSDYNGTEPMNGDAGRDRALPDRARPSDDSRPLQPWHHLRRSLEGRRRPGTLSPGKPSQAHGGPTRPRPKLGLQATADPDDRRGITLSVPQAKLGLRAVPPGLHRLSTTVDVPQAKLGLAAVAPTLGITSILLPEQALLGLAVNPPIRVGQPWLWPVTVGEVELEPVTAIVVELTPALERDVVLTPTLEETG